MNNKCNMCNVTLTIRQGTSRFDSKHKLCSSCCELEAVLGMYPREARENKLTWAQYKKEVKKRYKKMGVK